MDKKVPNETTKKAIKDAEEGKNLTEAKDVEELFEQLELDK
jgi:antitoxin component of RelBE/YafQ-DinJ toxin-antitoxin module